MKVLCFALLSPYSRLVRSVSSHHTPSKISNPSHIYVFSDCGSPPMIVWCRVALSMLPKALLKAGVAFRALFVEPLSTQLFTKIIENHPKTLVKSMVLAFSYMLLHFASMHVPNALLGALVAFRALFVEPLSTQLAPKIIQKP